MSESHELATMLNLLVDNGPEIIKLLEEVARSDRHGNVPEHLGEMADAVLSKIKKKQFTPEPWYDDGYRIYGPATDGPATDGEDKRNGQMIVEYKHVSWFNQPDSTLIAKAPELYSMLKAILPLAGRARDIIELVEKGEALLEEIEKALL